MKVVLIILILLAITNSIHLSSDLDDDNSDLFDNSKQDQQYFIVGGFSDYPVTNLDSVHQQIDKFIRKNVPEVANWTLTKIRQQVVAGMNYCYTYEDTSSPQIKPVQICVWSKPWEGNFLKLTTPDNKTIISQDPHWKYHPEE